MKKMRQRVQNNTPAKHANSQVTAMELNNSHGQNTLVAHPKIINFYKLFIDSHYRLDKI